jgi:hypothetical protein
MEENPENKPGQEVADLILKGRKIQAIKVVRETTGVGLKEAKEMVDLLQAELARKHPDLVIPNKSGCGAASAVFVVSTLGVLTMLVLRVIE